jgi:hypothetical protein
MAMIQRTKNYYDELIRLLNLRDSTQAKDKQMAGILANESNKDTAVLILQSRMQVIRELAEINGLLKAYPLDEIYLFNNAVWSFNEKRFRDSIKEVKHNFKNRDFSEPEPQREERLNLAIAFLFGYLLMSGKATEAVILSVADEAGLSFVVSYILISGLYKSQNSSINNNDNNNKR